jgi:hypothetical protein
MTRIRATIPDSLGGDTAIRKTVELAATIKNAIIAC